MLKSNCKNGTVELHIYYLSTIAIFSVHCVSNSPLWKFHLGSNSQDVFFSFWALSAIRKVSQAKLMSSITLVYPQSVMGCTGVSDWKCISKSVDDAYEGIKFSSPLS